MRVAIILNGISRKKSFFYANVYPQLKENFNIAIFETRYAGHAIELAKYAADNAFDTILSAGGDGTLNQVLNGILISTHRPYPSLGLIPMGSANDFARAVGLTSSIDQLLKVLKENSPALVDVGKVVCKDSNGSAVNRYFINTCSVGMGPLVVERLERNRKKWGATLSYLSSIITTFFTHQPQLIKCKTDLWEWEGKARVVALANGVSFGNGIYIAPEANLRDGKLNLFRAEDVPLLKFLVYLQTIKARKKITSNLVNYSLVTSIELSSTEKCALETEGEIIGYLPAKIHIVPLLIKFYGS